MGYQFNGQAVSADALRIAEEAEAIHGDRYIASYVPVSGALKDKLRSFYVATGGQRSTASSKLKGVHRDPNAEEYRAMFNGTTTGAEVLAKIKAEAGVKPVEPTPVVAAGAFYCDHGYNLGNCVIAGCVHAQVAPTVPPLTKPADPQDDTARKLKEVLEGIMGGQKIDDAAIQKIVDERLLAATASIPALVAAAVENAVRVVEFHVPNQPPVTVKGAHRMLETLVRALRARVNPMLVGPAGSGKTTLAAQAAEVLGVKFYATSRISSEYKLTGFTDAAGKAVRTSFREAYEHGGLFLFDEIDASDADAITSFNGPLDADWADFPDGNVKRHPDFYAVAAANTWGMGATPIFVGRQQLDGASRDRFSMFPVEYDEEMELAMAGPDTAWTKYVQRVRAAVFAEGIMHVVSPRASRDGNKLLAAGIDRQMVEDAVIWKGLDAGQKARILEAM